MACGLTGDGWTLSCFGRTAAPAVGSVVIFLDIGGGLLDWGVAVGAHGTRTRRPI